MHGAPLGISFFGTAFSERTLIKLASGFEAATHARQKNLPTFADQLPNTNIQGTTLTKPRKTKVVESPNKKMRQHHL